LGILGLIISQLIAIPVGMFSALRQDTWGDFLARSFAILMIGVPGFWLGTILIVFPSIWWGWSPPLTFVPFVDDPIENMKILVLPAIVMGMSMSGSTMRITRTMMLEVLRQDYIRTAWAKGLKERVIVLRHSLQNALIPIITVIGYYIPVLFGGTVIIETIFSLPGMGRLLVDATQKRDYTIVSGILLLFAFGMVFINLCVDIVYGFLDPRIRYR
jgi:peptide/nickel transport system permease protein